MEWILIAEIALAGIGSKISCESFELADLPDVRAIRQSEHRLFTGPTPPPHVVGLKPI
jgi:hypothetical protein